ncbi:hypothetical protein Pmani_034831 [Petrolisthes manimaculis]|uniref:Uncharacterized protein n=1 Tax=Petrolisthes manimaculis TaxID=1843537 RepID=A0AAE1TPA2_9EUCA|nr:hypothetical protein Pmani_034831 [Petrolisthes manimaculis]
MASLQQASSSVRLLLLGCFQCHALKPNCWRRQDEQQDGAWFDSDKLQVEQAYCYVNPVALSEASTTNLSSPASLPHQQQQPSLTHHHHQQQSPFTHHQQPLRQPTTSSPTNTTTESFYHRNRKLGIQNVTLPSVLPHNTNTTTPTTITTTHSHHTHTNTNTTYSPSRSNTKNKNTPSHTHKHHPVEKTLVPNGRLDLHGGDMSSSEVVCSRGEGVVIKEDVVRYTTSEFRSPLVESFAAKLEADLRKLEYDRQRAEGEVVVVMSNERRESEEGVEEDVLYGDGRCCDVKNMLLSTSTSDNPMDLEGERIVVEGEVWEPAELEEAFECYNMAAYYSYGTSFPGTDKFTSSKTRGEKYEEVFPVNYHNNNNNTIKVFKPACESLVQLPTKDDTTIENVQEIDTTKENYPVTEDQLRKFIETCIVVDSAEELTMLYHGRTTDTRVDPGGSLFFGGKSFNNLLIFNLVKSVMRESEMQSVCGGKYPTHIVQRRVLSVLLEGKKDTVHTAQAQANPSGLQVFRNSSLLSASENESYQNQLVARRLVDGVVASEVREEDRQWQDFTREERELKDAVAAELFDDLICDTTNMLSSLWRRKMNQ